MASLLSNVVDFLSRGKDVTGLTLSPRGRSFLELMSRDVLSPVRLGEENRNWVAACTTAISQSVASIDFQLNRYGGDGQAEIVKEHPVFDLLAYVNSVMSQFELFEITSTHLSIYGNAIWLLDGVDDNGNGIPTAIYPLIPKYIKVKQAPLPQVIEEYTYTIDNKVWTFKPARVIHFRDTNGENPLWGMGKLEKAFDSVEADAYTRLWSKAFFKNGAKVDGVIEVPTAITPEQAKELLDVFNMKHQGIGRAHRTALIPMGGKLVEHGVTPKDMDFPNLRQTSRDEILALFGVPKSILGIVDDVNRANAEASNFVFADRTVKPQMRKITDALNEFLVPLFGSENLWLTFTDPVPENRLEKLEEFKAALGGKPWMTVNEVRRSQGLADIENGDSVMTDFASIPLGEAKPEAVPKKNLNRRFVGKAFNKDIALRRKTVSSAKSLGDEIAKTLRDTLKKKSEQGSLDEAEWKRFQVTVTPYVRSVTERLKDLADDQMKTVLEGLPEAVKGMTARLAVGDVNVKVVNVDDLLDDDNEVSIMSNALKPIYQELTEKEGTAVLAKITGAAFDARNERVQKMLAHSIGLLSKEYTKTTKSKLRDTLEEGLMEGESVDALADRIGKVYKEIETNRAYSVALTETNRVGNLAAKEAMKQSGVVKTVRWYTSGSDVCDFCKDLQGQVEDINSAFFSKGDTMTVEDADGYDQTLELNYDDVETPPLHTNCYCYVRPEEISL